MKTADEILAERDHRAPAAGQAALLHDLPAM